MGFDLKVLIGLGAAAATAAVALASTRSKKSEEKKAVEGEKKDEEVLAYLKSIHSSYGNLNNEVCNEICINKKEIVDTVKDFFRKFQLISLNFKFMIMKKPYLNIIHLLIL